MCYRAIKGKLIGVAVIAYECPFSCMDNRKKMDVLTIEIGVYT